VELYLLATLQSPNIFTAWCLIKLTTVETIHVFAITHDVTLLLSLWYYSTAPKGSGLIPGAVKNFHFSESSIPVLGPNSACQGLVPRR
jgi:hypothetical protein